MVGTRYRWETAGRSVLHFSPGTGQCVENYREAQEGGSLQNWPSRILTAGGQRLGCRVGMTLQNTGHIRAL